MRFSVALWSRQARGLEAGRLRVPRPHRRQERLRPARTPAFPSTIRTERRSVQAVHRDGLNSAGGISHKLIDSVAPADKKVRLSAAKARLEIELGALKRHSCRPVAASHKRIPTSEGRCHWFTPKCSLWVAERIKRPSGDHATVRTPAVWPRSCLISRPVSTSHNRTTQLSGSYTAPSLSALPPQPLTNCRPSGENAMAYNRLVCTNDRSSRPLATSQSRAVPSKLADSAPAVRGKCHAEYGVAMAAEAPDFAPVASSHKRGKSSVPEAPPQLVPAERPSLPSGEMATP